MALRVKVSTRAASQVRRAAGWWLENRPSAPGAIATDFGEGVALLAEQPGIGSKYTGTRAPGARRLYLGRVGYFVYYRTSPEALEIWRFGMPDVVGSRGFRGMQPNRSVATDTQLQGAARRVHSEPVLGFAAISLTFSLVEPAPDRRRQCWLKELYVRESHRGMGVGETLMTWVARYAIENACCRVDWPVRASNSRGISFYERLGAKLVDDRLSYRLGEPDLGTLARSTLDG